MPYRDTANPTVAAWWDAYKAKFGSDPNIGAVYGQGIADMLIKVFEKAGKDLTTDSFLKAMESIKGYRDIFGGPVVSFGPDRHHVTDEEIGVAHVCPPVPNTQLVCRILLETNN